MKRVNINTDNTTGNTAIDITNDDTNTDDANVTNTISIATSFDQNKYFHHLNSLLDSTSSSNSNNNNDSNSNSTIDYNDYSNFLIIANIGKKNNVVDLIKTAAFFGFCPIGTTTTTTTTTITTTSATNTTTIIIINIATNTIHTTTCLQS